MKLTIKNTRDQKGYKTVIATMLVALMMPIAGHTQDDSVEEIVEALQAKVNSLNASANLEHGRQIYFRACAPCHGIRGDGKGPAAKRFDPAPRNFRRGAYKFRTTVSGVLPLDADLERTVREGVPGTEMPRWKNVLSESDIKAVVRYVKTFSPLFADPDSQPLPEDILEIPEERSIEPSMASIAAGRLLFVEQDCIKCHGNEGRGDGEQADELVDDWDVPIRPANLTQPFFKNGKQDRDIYRVFTSGLNGTPMPAFDELTEDQRWQLADYLQSLEQEKTFMYWLFKEKPNQVRHPELKPGEASSTDG